MNLIANILIGFVAVLHVCFLILEMFLWTHPIGLKVFAQSLEKASASVVLAANQGLYNGFLSAGLVWSLIASDTTQAQSLKLFFLSCVLVAGLYGAYSVHKKIFFVQALPALIAMLLVFIAK